MIKNLSKKVCHISYPLLIKMSVQYFCLIPVLYWQLICEKRIKIFGKIANSEIMPFLLLRLKDILLITKSLLIQNIKALKT